MLIKEQNNSNQSSLVICPSGFLSSTKIKYLVFNSKSYIRFDFKKFPFFK